MLNLACMGFSMSINQDLINKCQSDLDDFGSLMKCQATELLDNYIKLVEQNAELHKELVKFKAQSFSFNNGVNCSDIPSDLAM